MKENYINITCSMNREKRNPYILLVGKPEGKRMVRKTWYGPD
jgi:hypothetical protein